MQRNKNTITIFITLLILLAACPAYCGTYFVAPDGDDSSTTGDINHPYKTITKAVGVVAAGGTIYLRGGVHYYTAKISTISKSGTSGNLITMQNYQDEAPILDFNGVPWGTGSNRGINLSGSYWHFKGFTLRYAPDNGLYVTGSYNTFEQLIAYGNQDTGITLYTGASYNQVINCDSYNNYDPCTFGGNADGFGAKGPTSCTTCLGPGNEFHGCRAWDNSDDGFDLWWAHNPVIIENCWAWHNGWNVWGVPPAQWRGNGVGFKMGQGPGAHKIIRCMAYYNWLSGFDLNRSHGDTEANGVTVDNCTGVRSQHDPNNFKFPDPNVGIIHTLHNNISHIGSTLIGSRIYNTYNTWNPGFTVSDSNFVSLDPNGLDGPRGPNGELPKLKFLRLSVSSALIDAGMDVNEPYNGSAPDLGAFEHIDGDCYTDGEVDLLDLKCLADNWLDSGCGDCNQADFSGDNKVNFYDFAKMAENWLK